MDDSFLTIKAPAQAEIKVKGSRFIGETREVAHLEEAAAELEKIRKREHAATHHCYAYRIGRGSQAVFKYSDDGEPSGTAGKPIYDVLVGHELTNALIVVTRYFGGTKLGTGGLARAYRQAAKEAVEKSGVREVVLKNLVRIRTDFSSYEPLVRLLHRYSAPPTEVEFTDVVTLTVAVRRRDTQQVVNEIIQLTNGKAEVTIDETE